MFNLVQLSSSLLTTTMRPISSAQHSSVVSLLKEAILIIKFNQKLVWGGVLGGGLARKWRGTKKAILEAVLPGLQHMTNKLLFGKSLLESLTMLFKLPSSSIPSLPILFHVILSEEH
jgi:hypothetical protein